MFRISITRIGGLTALGGVLNELGFDPDLCVRQAGLEPAIFSDPDAMPPSTALGRLFSHCTEATGCAHLGLLVGGKGALASLGRIGFIARHSPDVDTALRSLAKNFHHHDRSTLFGLRRERGQAVISFEPLFAMEAQAQWLGFTMSLGMKIMRELCGSGWGPSEVTFAMPRPKDVKPYERLFRSRLTFDAAESSIIFDPHWLKRPVAGAEPELHRILNKDLEKHIGLSPEGLRMDLRRLVRERIGTPRCTLKNIGAQLGLNAHLISEKLEEAGTNFKQIVEDVRFEMAKQLLLNTDIALKDVAERLEYSEISAFTRAFSRWAGKPPGDWRRTSREMMFASAAEG